MRLPSQVHLNCALAVASCLTISSPVLAQVNVLTQHNDNTRQGQNTSETVLKPSNVNYTDFGLLAMIPVDGWVYAQPLVLSNVSIGGGTHNVVFVATENDSVYALDATTGAQYWKKSFINPSGGITVPTESDIGCSDISSEYGITSTPVIDPMAGTIYVVANTLENGTYYYRLHALNVSTGAERTGSPIAITDSAGTFNAQLQNQRSALLLDIGHVVFGFSSHCDHNTWEGWVFSYNASTLVRENYFVTVPASNGGRGGLWMGGDGIAADASGNIFLATGNGHFDGTTSFGDSILRLPVPPSSGNWAPVDYYTPGDQSNLSGNDLDLGAGGVVLLPNLPSGTAHYQRLAQAGKEGKISIVDRNSMGHYCCSSGGTDTNIVQEISGELPNGMYGSPSYWNGNIYFGGYNDNVKDFSFNLTTGAVSTTPIAKSQFDCGGADHTSCTTSVSSSGTSNGIVWALDSGSGILYAANASNLAELYDSNQISYRDRLNGGVKFLAPTVANGKVYVGSYGFFGIYGEGPAAVYWTITIPGSQFPCETSGGGIETATVAASESPSNSLSWTISATDGPKTLLVNWQIADSAGTLGSGQISGVQPKYILTASRAPVGDPVFSGTVTSYGSTGTCIDLAPFSFAMTAQ